jgi:dipeptidyl-peptidase 4
VDRGTEDTAESGRVNNGRAWTATRRHPRQRGRAVFAWLLASGAAALTAASPAAAQGTLGDYIRAERFLGWNARFLLSDEAPRPVFVEGDRFWYRSTGVEGQRFVLVDPAAGSVRPAFDHGRLAAALSVAADTSYRPDRLPFERFEIEDGGRAILVPRDSARVWRCDVQQYRCAPAEREPTRVTEVISPDGQWTAFERDNDLWVRSRTTGEEFALSQGGEKYFGFATNPEACCDAVTRVRQNRAKRPILAWSPDSRRIATHRLDERNVEDLHLLETAKGRPILHSFRYALPGDSVIPRWEVHVFDVARRTGVASSHGAQDAVNTSCCWLTTDTIWKDARWGSGSDEFYYTHGRRDFRKLELVAVNAVTGAARVILTETGPTFLETNLSSGGIPNWRVINGNREVIWFSQRDGWAHLYLYDAQTGALKNRITEGAWTVGDVLHVDEPGRWVYFTARGREPGRDPYFRHLYRARLDGSRIELLTPEDADHDISAAPSGRFIVDTYSRFDASPVTVVRRLDGRVTMDVQRVDVSPLLAQGWPWPERVSVRARDGVTELHGLVFRPSSFDAHRRYPVINYIYPGPQVGSIGGRGFTVNPRGNAQALAELGFIVVQIDALGTPLRSKAFHDTYYRNMGDNGIPDQIAGMQQLAARYPEMDLTRVGIFGHSGGGFASTGAILRYPDFFHVAVSTAGNHDNRSYDYTWGEKYHGLLEENANGGDNFDSQANHLLADNLKGKLLLMYGTLDDNVHPNATLLLVDELIRHDKDFDLLVLPNRNHGFANEPYVLRRTWDYFVRHLHGVEPPANFRLQPAPR